MHLQMLSFSSLYVEAWGTNLNDGTKFGMASGSAAIYKAPDALYLITAKHVVNGLDSETGKYLDRYDFVPRSLKIHFAHSGSHEPLVLETELLDDNNDPLWLEHRSNASVDVVCIRLAVEDVSADALVAPLDPFRHIVLEDLVAEADRKVVNLATPDLPIPLTVPSQLFAIGFPFGARGTWPAALWVTGHIASEPEMDYGGDPCFLLDARTRTGLSGAPVIRHLPAGTAVPIDDDVWESAIPATELVGIYSGRLNEQSDLGRVWRASVVAEILDAHDPGVLNAEV